MNENKINEPTIKEYHSMFISDNKYNEAYAIISMVLTAVSEGCTPAEIIANELYFKDLPNNKTEVVMFVSHYNKQSNKITSDDYIEINSFVCPVCGRTHTLYVKTEDYLKTTKGVRPQEAYPYLDKWTIESLITGCDSQECYSKWVNNQNKTYSVRRHK